ncbi:hypothetical protein MKX01_038569 [Papaver californicum]|nr:hypothetical protein MKX01_038569 [Papaver californicum]
MMQISGEVGNHTIGLTHHLAEMAAILQYQDSVPCKIRAKRGCATHPCSIAERVRRTRIIERIRELEELVPNMDKQTNIADMLDLAVEYIKDLQTQVKVEMIAELKHVLPVLVGIWRTSRPIRRIFLGRRSDEDGIRTDLCLLPNFRLCDPYTQGRRHPRITK